MSDIALAMRDLDEDRVKELVESELSRGVPPLDILAALNQGVVGVGELYEAGEYFVSQLMFAAEILTDVMEILGPAMAVSGSLDPSKVVVIGTVAGDVHDIGKNIVGTLLRGSGYNVIDLGVDVPASKFVEAVSAHKPKILGLSALLSFTYPEMKAVVDSLNESGLRSVAKVVIGGAPCTEEVRVYSGADFYAPTAMDTVNYVNKICGQ